MILSASVNADVPARYGSWFRRRLEAGFLRVAGADLWKQRRIELDASNVDGFVFWTRDVTPFLPLLRELRTRGIAFVVQYALTADAAPRVGQAAIAAIRELARNYGPRAVVWRYDPVVLDAGRSVSTHGVAFTAFARALSGAVDEVVIAFDRNARRAHRRHGNPAATEISIPAPEVGSGKSGDSRRELVRGLAMAAAGHGMRLTICANADALTPGASPARCIDVRRLAHLAGRSLEAPTAGFMRDCLCAQAIDIGDYGGSEPARFCGADPRSRMRLRHDPESEFLFEPGERFRSARPGDFPF